MTMSPIAILKLKAQDRMAINRPSIKTAKQPSISLSLILASGGLVHVLAASGDSPIIPVCHDVTVYVLSGSADLMAVCIYTNSFIVEVDPTP